jgi:hypothetical protein
MSYARSAFVILLALTASGCRLLDFDSCLYELRGVEAAGTISESGSELLYGRLNLVEQRDYQPEKSLVWQVRGAPLKGHVTSALFRDADQPKALFVLTLSPAPASDIAGGTANQSEGADLNGFYDVLAANRGVIDVRTNLPGRDSIRLAITKTFQEDWYRPKCG